MTHSFHATHRLLALFALSSLLACQTASDAVSAGASGASAGGARGIADGGGGTGASSASEAGDTGLAGSAATGGSAGNGSGPTRGLILLTQATVKSEALMIDSAHYGLSAMFATQAEVSRELAAATATTIGDCTATAVTIDPNAPRLPPNSGLDAGTITVTGIRMPPSLVIDYAANDAGTSAYGHAAGDTRFYEDGDVISVRGAGGPDLPAFESVSLKAPSDVALIAPSCVTGTCPDLDHTKDLLVEWENGGDGKVDFLVETVAETKVVLLECKFDAASGKGIVPSALLAKLDAVDGNNVSGIQQITAIDEVTFPIGGVDTTFSIRSAQFEALLGATN